MKLWKSWVIAKKDFSVFMKKKRILYTLIILPLIFSFGLPLSIASTPNPTESFIVIAGMPLSVLSFFSFFYIILAYIIPTTLASYSIISEKIEQSLEPLLATPTSDGELLLGKSISSFLPCIVVIYASSVIFMVLSDLFTYNAIGYFFFPNWTMAIILLLAVPLSSILSVELNVIISSRVGDVRTAGQLGTLLLIPFVAFYALIVSSITSLNIVNIAVIMVVFVLIDLALFNINRATFNRDSMLTKWK